MPNLSRLFLTSFAALLGVLTAISSPAHAAEKRAFRMGFTPFVHDTTLEAVAEMRQFLRANADIVAQHIESVPWTEALHDQPFHESLMND